MDNTILETKYPISFRKEDAEEFGKLLKNRQSVVLIGMPRVGISNFLRFFLYHEDVVKEYIDKAQHHIFIPVDLNDLVEREVFPFWVLTLKRIMDTVHISVTLSEKVKKEIEQLFVHSIQSKDLFILIDNVRKSLAIIISSGLLPTLFFVRFDRIKNAISPEFFANLQGLKDATNLKLAYVFTGTRSLDSLAPDVFSRSSLAVFSKDMYIKPAKKDDAKIILETYKKRYGLALSKEMEEKIIEIAGGYVQYLQLALIFLQHHKAEVSTQTLLQMLLSDEQILLQSEELWENLDEKEQGVLRKVAEALQTSTFEKKDGGYLWDSGMIVEQKGKGRIFCPLLSEYITKKEFVRPQLNSEFSKKEHLLFSFLLQNKNEICEREKIIEAVWPEEETFGVSDWAIDRLAARVRNKLKLQNSEYEIQTIKTRGYKLV